MVLHELKHIRISPIKEGNATHGDFSIDGGKPYDIIVHKHSVLGNPIPGRVEMISLEAVKERLYSFNRSIAVLAVDAVELGLQRNKNCRRVMQTGRNFRKWYPIRCDHKVR